MNEENQISYYSIILATVRYNKKLKPAEKLMYGEITALFNKNGYCYAQNRYFANLYNVSIETVSRWLSNLQKLGFIKIEINKNENKEIISRYIYIVDLPYRQKGQYLYPQKNQEGIDENIKDNNIKYNIDELISLLENKSSEIPVEFYMILKRLEVIYPKEIINRMNKDSIDMINNIIYTLYDLYHSGFSNLLSIVKRESLINLYILSKDYKPDDLLNYYKRTIINKYTQS